MTSFIIYSLIIRLYDDSNTATIMIMRISISPHNAHNSQSILLWPQSSAFSWTSPTKFCFLESKKTLNKKLYSLFLRMIERAILLILVLLFVMILWAVTLDDSSYTLRYIGTSPKWKAVQTVYFIINIVNS